MFFPLFSLAFVASVVWIVTTYAIRNFTGQQRTNRFGYLMLAATAALTLLVAGASLPMIAVGWTASGLALAALVNTRIRRRPESPAGWSVGDRWCPTPSSGPGLSLRCWFCPAPSIGAGEPTAVTRRRDRGRRTRGSSHRPFRTSAAAFVAAGDC